MKPSFPPLTRHLIIIMLACVMLPVHAHAREEGAPAAALGIGDAVRATATGASGLFFNPAGIGLLSQYSIEAGYTFTDDMAGHALGASAVDSKTNAALAMGVGYAFLMGEEDSVQRQGHQVRGAISSGWRWEDFAFRVGVGGRYLTLDNTALGGEQFFTLDAGLVMEIVRMFRIGVSAQNLVDTRTGAHRNAGLAANPRAPRQLGAGAALTIQAFQASFDATMDLQTDPNNLFVQYAVGAQYLIANMVVMRAGFQLGGYDDHQTVTFGAGYVSDMLAADVSVAKRVDRDGGIVASFAFRYFLP